jgi:hypothetical protein
MTSSLTKPVTQPTPEQTEDLVLFVRRGLGCGCPDEVFSHIRIELQPEAFEGLPVDCLVRIGGRLLVAVCTSSEWREAEKKLDLVLKTGKNLRDQNRFNRFRFVLMTEEAERAAQMVEARFYRLTGMDDRVHVHVVGPSALPSCLT